MDCRCVKPANYSDSKFLKIAREEYPLLDLPFVGTNDTDAHQLENINGVSYHFFSHLIYGRSIGGWEFLPFRR